MEQWYYYPSCAGGEAEAKEAQVPGPEDTALEWQSQI